MSKPVPFLAMGNPLAEGSLMPDAIERRTAFRSQSADA